MILPTTYLGSVEWYRLFWANPSAVEIEVMESFPKQTYRNRCTISQAISRKGDETIGRELLMLSVPVKRADSKQLTRDVEISYQQKWQHQHWIALMSAYKRTPYFDYYAEFFRPFYEKETRFLVDLNEGLHDVITRLILNKAKEEEVKELLEERRTLEWQGLDLDPCFGSGQSILDWLFEYGPETIIKL
jgi:hypothetical protein